MKKALYFSAAALALLGASCSQEDVAPIGQDGMTTLSITIPGELTSRYGDAAEPPALYLAIYKAGTTDLLFSTFTNTPKNASSITGGDFGAPADNTNIRTATVQVPLVKGMAYDIVCWAQNPEVTDYTFDADEKTISVTYGTTNTIGNYAEKRDAFFGQALNFVSEGKGAEITLTRPFAQINVGTSDWTKYTAAGGSADNPFGLTITGVANTLNLTNGEITAPETTATITVTGATTESNTDAFPAGTEYTYLAMAYVLANQNLTVGLTGMGDGYDAWRNVPVKANYRTNIYGTLLTNAEDFTITLDPNWTGDINEQRPIVTINSNDNAAIVSELNNGGNFILTSDVDNLDLSTLDRTKPTSLTLTGNVSTLRANTTVENPALLNINIPKDVPYPSFDVKQGDKWENLTLEGDVSSTELSPAINFKFAYAVKNFTVKNVPFEQDGINLKWISNTSVVDGITIEGCVLNNVKNYFIVARPYYTEGTVQANITVRNNKVTFADEGVDTSMSGIYLDGSNGNILIEGNTITNAPYNGIFWLQREPSNCQILFNEEIIKNTTTVIRNNIVVNAARDGIKCDIPFGKVTITGNTVQNANRIGIQCTRFEEAWNYPTITISDNSVSTSNPDNPAILFEIPADQMTKFTGSAIIKVFGNIKVGTNNNWFEISNFIPAAGSEYSNPFAN